MCATSVVWSHRRRRMNIHTHRQRERERESEIVNLKARHGHCAQGRFLRVAAGFRMAAVTLQHLATSVRVVGAPGTPPSRYPSLTVRANQWPGLVLVISHSQVPEVARVVARRTQQRLKLPPQPIRLDLSQQTHLPCLPCLLYFIRCSGVTSNPAHVEVHSICGDLRLPWLSLKKCI